jgi:hypothetical protein
MIFLLLLIDNRNNILISEIKKKDLDDSLRGKSYLKLSSINMSPK